MKIYEMIFHKGNYEQTNSFYTVNNKASREHFIAHIRLELDSELNNFKLSCTSDSKADLLSLFEEVQNESFLYVNAIVDDFIQKSEAAIDQYIRLIVKEHDVLCF